jgi:hypothetical protein
VRDTVEDEDIVDHFDHSLVSVCAAT